MQHKTIALNKSITRYIFVALILLIAHASAFAQKASFGARAGLNFANITFTGYPDGVNVSSKAGLDIAAFMEYNVSKNVSIVPELGLVAYGANADYEGVVNSKIKTSYIQLPVLVKYRFNNGISLAAGPQLAFLLKGEQKDDDSEKEDIKKYLKKTDIMLTFGAGYEFSNGFGIGLRYNAGLIDIYDADIPGLSAKNHSFGIHLSYRLAPRK
ncbi:MAG TPA: porin family protein [Chitinophagaceae bacterium]|jgi:hypothetical protein|nr:porin family protein [Chitinophagaceae bacterium]